MEKVVRTPIVYLSRPDLLGRIKLEIVSPPNPEVLPWLPMPKIDTAAIEAKVRKEEEKANQKAKRMESFNAPAPVSASVSKTSTSSDNRKVGLGFTSSKTLSRPTAESASSPTEGRLSASRHFVAASGGGHRRSVDREKDEGERRTSHRRARRGNQEIDLSRLQQNIFGN